MPHACEYTPARTSTPLRRPSTDRIRVFVQYQHTMAVRSSNNSRGRKRARGSEVEGGVVVVLHQWRLGQMVPDNQKYVYPVPSVVYLSLPCWPSNTYCIVRKVRRHQPSTTAGAPMGGGSCCGVNLAVSDYGTIVIVEFRNIVIAGLPRRIDSVLPTAGQPRQSLPWGFLDADLQRESPAVIPSQHGWLRHKKQHAPSPDCNENPRATQ